MVVDNVIKQSLLKFTIFHASFPMNITKLDIHQIDQEEIPKA